ncbi:MAG TPA: Crp/Fnr family transcriptional regulator [Pyrinomonadaceae bacterium]|nr:Crp/Fnr family transcriptional regulator [Pyrinomonadaceae bacterium]
MESPQVSNSQNLFLKFLPEDEYQRFLPDLELTKFARGEKIYLPDEKIEYVYFPNNLVASVVANLENGSTIETGVIGKDGIVGVEIVLSEDAASREVNIQLAGECFRLKSEIFKAAFERSSFVRKQVLRYVGSYISQISQNSACLSFHEIEQRLSRWLLMFHDCSASDELKLTQEFIALMLGVHRPSVSKSANKLQEKGFISYNRGKITILNRKGLEDYSCECYEVDKQFRNLWSVNGNEKNNCVI